MNLESEFAQHLTFWVWFGAIVAVVLVNAVIALFGKRD